MKKILAFAGAIALSIIPTPSFSGEVEQQEMMSVTEKLLPQIGEKFKNLDIKDKKAYRRDLNAYFKYIQKTGNTGLADFAAYETVSDRRRRLKAEKQARNRTYDRTFMKRRIRHCNGERC